MTLQTRMVNMKQYRNNIGWSNISRNNCALSYKIMLAIINKNLNYFDYRNIIVNKDKLCACAFLSMYMCVALRKS